MKPSKPRNNIFIRAWSTYKREGGKMNLKGFASRWNELKKEAVTYK